MCEVSKKAETSQCVACDDTKYFLASGRCRGKVKCTGGKIEENGGSCNCHPIKGIKSDCFR